MSQLRTKICSESRLLCLLLTLLLGCLWTAHAEETEQFDVRVLIDVSGSMKQSDPANLRKPALKLLVSLLPDNARSGVWLFDGSVTELANPAKATPIWVNQALKASSQIHSDGKFTDIEKAIATATEDWQQPEDGTLRSLILLTDGVVDVSRNALHNFQSRKRILDEQLAPLIQQGVKINTIALSKEADTELMERLSSKTGGWHETATNADELQPIFLKMFKKSVRRDSLPIKNNRFQIDRSINEFSAILFRKNGARATQLEDPEGMDFGQESNRDKVRWQHEPGYDIVTVRNPMEGQWNFVAKADPDNEIMVVTNLKMYVSRVPNELHHGQPHQVEMYVTEKDKLIDQQMFLDIFKIKFTLTDAAGVRTELGMEQDLERPGYFVRNIGENLELGQYALTVEVDGSTFQREDKQLFDVVVAPLPSETIEPPIPEPVIAPPTIDPQPAPAEINLAAPPISLLPQPAAAPPIPIVAPAISEPTPPPAETEPAPEPAPDEEEGLSWMVMVGIGLAVNLLLGVGGYFGYKKFKSKDAEAEAELINKLST